MGLDDPYPLGELDGVGTSYPGRVVDYALEIGVLNKNEVCNIWHKNVLDWLGKKQDCD